MRTADYYVKIYADFRNDLNMTDSIKLLVETVRKEAIEECAMRVDGFIFPSERLQNDLKTDILSLIKELK